jgi:hypothetical protein
MDLLTLWNRLILHPVHIERHFWSPASTSWIYALQQATVRSEFAKCERLTQTYAASRS